MEHARARGLRQTPGVRPALLLLPLLVAACSPTPDVADAGDAAADADPFVGTGSVYDSDASVGAKVAIVLRGCDGVESCHGQSAAGLTFPPGDEAVNLVGVPSTEMPDVLRVAPFDPDHSYLYAKTELDGSIDGSRMPQGAAFDPRLPALVHAWIEAGAPKP